MYLQPATYQLTHDTIYIYTFVCNINKNTIIYIFLHVYKYDCYVI